VTATLCRRAALALIAVLLAQPTWARPTIGPSLRARSTAQAQTPAAQPPQTPSPPPRSPYDEPSAPQTREQFHRLLRQQPSSLWQVLRYDPSLLSDRSYLQPYPSIAAFVEAHPEIVRDPRYFVGAPEYGSELYNSAEGQRARAMRDMFLNLYVLIGFLTVAAVVVWTLKTVVDHRRWLRLTRVQTETHTKLVDRFTSNDELLAYIQTPAGRRFLEAGPVGAEAPKSVGAPYGRILWALQAGTVVSVLGVGLLYVSRTLARDPGLADASPFMFVLGAIAVAIGVGFVLSAFLSYAVSRRLGLIDAAAAPHA
jgi:hypothetical protein